MVLVIKRKLHRPKGSAIFEGAKQCEDPSFDIEKPPIPVEFTRTSYACGFKMKLIRVVKIPKFRLKEIFGEPTRIMQKAVEWVVKIPTKEVLKIVVTSKNVVEVHGHVVTKSVEKWIERLETA